MNYPWWASPTRKFPAAAAMPKPTDRKSPLTYLDLFPGNSPSPSTFTPGKVTPRVYLCAPGGGVVSDVALLSS